MNKVWCWQPFRVQGFNGARCYGYVFVGDIEQPEDVVDSKVCIDIAKNAGKANHLHILCGQRQQDGLGIVHAGVCINNYLFLGRYAGDGKQQ